MILVDRNPLEDLGLFQGQGAHLSLIMKDGALHKDAALKAWRKKWEPVVEAML